MANARNGFTNDFLASIQFVTHNKELYEESMHSAWLQNLVVPLLDLGTLGIAGFYYMAVIRARQKNLKEDAGLEDLESIPCCMNRNDYRNFKN
jgi:hypothetical protein